MMEPLFVHYTAKHSGLDVTNAAVMQYFTPISTIDNIVEIQTSIEKRWGYIEGSVRLTFWCRMEPETQPKGDKP